jgi:hypothetical protein
MALDAGPLQNGPYLLLEIDFPGRFGTGNIQRHRACQKKNDSIHNLETDF